MLAEKTVTRSVRPLLVDLPPEVLAPIIAYYASRVANEARFPFERVMFMRAALMPLGLAHSKLLRPCVSHLWEDLCLGNLFQLAPVRVPSQAALMKYGSLVQSITVNLSSWKYVPIEPEAFHNAKGSLIADPEAQHRLMCLKTACNALKKVLPFCPQLRELKLHPEVFGGLNAEEPLRIATDFLSFLTSHVQNLRQLKLSLISETLIGKMIAGLPLLESLWCSNLVEEEGKDFMACQLSQLKNFTDLKLKSASTKLIIKLISHCPLIECLACVFINDWSPEKQHDDSLAKQISYLKHLTQLELEFFPALDESWSKHNWPGTLKKLSFEKCPRLELQHVPALLRRAAPKLTHLDLTLYILGEVAWNEVARLSCVLPALTHLKLDAVDKAEVSLIGWFKQSEDLRNFQQENPSDSDLLTLAALLSSSTWTKIQRIELSNVEQRERESVDRIQEHCNDHDAVFVWE